MGGLYIYFHLVFPHNFPLKRNPQIKIQKLSLFSTFSLYTTSIEETLKVEEEDQILQGSS